MPPKEMDMDFNLKEQVDIWIKKLKSDPSITEADAEELQGHLMDLIDQLKEKGLDDDEAFLIASRRLGTTADWGDDFRIVNNPILQMRRSVIIMGGVLLYFLIYFFILSSSKLLFVFLLNKEVTGYIAVQWISRYLITMHFIFILLFTSIMILEKKVVTFIEEIKLKPKHTIVLLLATFVFAIVNSCFSPVIRNMLNNDRLFIDRFYHIYKYFDFSFPLIICLGFIVIYFKYYKIAKF